MTYLRMHHLGFVPLLAARLFRSRCVVEVNGGPTDFLVNRPRLRVLSPALRAAWALTERLAHMGIVAGDAFLPHVPRLAARGRVHVVANGADLQTFNPRGKQVPLVAEPYALYFGTLTAWQGISDLLEATMRPAWPKDMSLALVGDGPEAERVREHPFFGERVHLFSRRPPEQLASHLRAAAVSVSPQGAARASANPLKVIESIACGVPVVVTDHPGQGDVVRSHRLGVVVPCDDSGALASGIRRASRMKPGFADRTADFRREHSWTWASHRILDAILDGFPSAQSTCDACHEQET